MFRILTLLGIAGAVVGYLGFQEYTLASGASVTPVKMELSELEGGAEPVDLHLSLGPHFAIYGGCFYEYTQKRGDSSEVTDKTQVTSTWYPIISPSHPTNQAWDQLAEKHGGLENVPEEEHPKFENFRVLVRTDRFKTVGSIPDGWEEESSVHGLVINRVKSLDSEERGLIKSNFPAVNFDELLILEQGRKPSTMVKALGMMGGGLAMLVAAIGALIWRRRRGG